MALILKSVTLKLQKYLGQDKENAQVRSKCKERMDIMTVMKEKAVDIISRMSEDKVYHVLQLLEGIEGLTGKNLEMDSMDISVNKSSGRKLGPLAGGLVFMADDFDETPDCFKEYM